MDWETESLFFFMSSPFSFAGDGESRELVDAVHPSQSMYLYS